MSALPGRTVRLFLAEGNASGLTTAEIMDWTGHVLAGSRNGLPAFLKRPELERTGIYFLTGPDPEDPDTRQVYIGESDVVGKRLAQHSKDESKVFWDRVCVVTSKDQNITKAHARYLEARLIAIASASGNVIVVNGTAPPPVSLPEADVSDMEVFIEQIKLIFPVLGLDFLPQYTVDAQADREIANSQGDRGDSPIFRLKNRKLGIEAQAREFGGKFAVLEGSTAVVAWSSNADHSYAKLHKRLVRSGKLVAGESARLRFSEDVVFSRPSAASAVILGRPDNGRTSWKLAESGKSYGEWESEQVDLAISTGAPEKIS